MAISTCPPYVCPKCGHDNSHVVDSRHMPVAIRRRRECGDCDSRWTTYELTESQLRVLEDASEGIDDDVRKETDGNGTAVV